MKLHRIRKLMLTSAIVAVVSYVVGGVVAAWARVAFEIFLWPFLVGILLSIICFLFSGVAAYTLGVYMKRPRIQVAAAVLGVLGGTMVALGRPFPLCPCLPPLLQPYPLALDLRTMYLLRGVGATLAFLMAIGGGLLALQRPRVGGILMLLSTLPVWIGMSLMWLRWSGVDLGAWWRIFDVGMFCMFSSLFLIPAGALALVSDKQRPAALVSDKQRPAAIYLAMTLGIMGGLIAALCPPLCPSAVFRGGLASLTWILLFPGAGLLGGMLVLGKPKVAGIMMLISGIIGPVGFIALGIPEALFELVICALAAAFLISGGAFAFAPGKKRPAAIYLAMILGVIGGVIVAPGALVLAVHLLYPQLENVWFDWIRLPFLVWILVFPGLFGGILVLARPKVAGILMLISGIFGSVGYIVLGIQRELPMLFVISAVAGLLVIIAGTIAVVAPVTVAACRRE